MHRGRSVKLSVLRIVEPSIALHRPWLDAHREWGSGLHEDGFGLLPSDEVETVIGFRNWIARVSRESTGDSAESGQYHCVYRWILDDDVVVGGIALRWGSDPFINAAGHIGYGIRPSARRRGIATSALAHVLKMAAEFHLEHVLLVCEAGNLASSATIESNGGILDSIEETEDGPMRRHWIALPVDR